jgi:hypothetical protein
MGQHHRPQIELHRPQKELHIPQVNPPPWPRKYQSPQRFLPQLWQGRVGACGKSVMVKSSSKNATPIACKS